MTVPAQWITGTVATVPELRHAPAGHPVAVCLLERVTDHGHPHLGPVRLVTEDAAATRLAALTVGTQLLAVGPVGWRHCGTENVPGVHHMATRPRTGGDPFSFVAEAIWRASPEDHATGVYTGPARV